MMNEETDVKDLTDFLNRVKEVEQIVKNERLITTSGVANKLGISRNTAGKCLAVLYAQGKLSYKQAGPSKIWMPMALDYDRLRENIIEVLRGLPHPIDFLENIRKELVEGKMEVKGLEVKHGRR